LQSAQKQGILTTVALLVAGNTTPDVDEADVDTSVTRPDEGAGVTDATAELPGDSVAAPLLTAATEDETLWLPPTCVALAPA
jgi:hypothetical protein